MDTDRNARDALATAIKESGGATQVASRLGVTIQRLGNWVDRGVPIEFARAIEAATECRVRCWDLRPDDWHRIWPELIGVEGAPPVPEVRAA